MRPAKIPATIITGFLGAGKTTLVRHLIETAGGKRIALIVNEFGDMGFDGGMLSDCGVPGCGADEVIELTNGCICCTVADDFLPAMQALMKRDPAPEHIVIETSGLALPQPLVRAFQWPDVRERVTVDGVITVVDARAVADGHVAMDEDAVAAQRAADEALDHDSPIEELFEDQLRCADLIVLSKSDLCDEAEIARVQVRVAEDARADVAMLKADMGRLPADVLLGLDSGAEDDMESRRAHHDHHNDDDDHDDDEHHDHHHHDDFESFVVRAAPAISLADARERVAAVVALPGVLRVKGHVWVAGKPSPAVVQAVGPRVEAWFAAAADKRPGLVVIGLKGVDKARIEAMLAQEAVV
ncbi:cobalamin biosynthesis protein CobW [Breoghania corrubedonensis]|uniref:Cobalamin biosynthesis protein CobW n=1 Tax=Breoghania corrubedonensis TaxID=665038 RepID=A0A2T5V9F9_9HYPH|nr:cobalamin biosynthesis protein CobW [Breoghania corrubedonensis]PTW60392.1 cobalamin biosynthesis protein CobW [Breoghania corrubedonensis]